MKFSVDKQEKYSLISLNEEKLDSSISPLLKSEFITMNAEGFRNIILDLSKTKEFVAKLMKGGGIKGHLTIGETYSKVLIILQPIGKNLELDEKGNFEILNIKPGQYTLSIKKTHKDAQPDFAPTFNNIAVQIKSGEITVINLDEMLK